jgi:hypothetical protein
MNVRRGRDGVGAFANRPDNRSFRDVVAARDARRAQLEQRDRKAVGGPDRDCAAAARNSTDERDRTGGGCPDGAPELGADIDAAMLAAGVGVIAEDEWAKDLPVGRPRPSKSGRRDDERRQDDRGNERSPHRKPPSVVVEGNSHPR